MNISKQIVGSILKCVRKFHGLKQIEFCMKLNLTQGTLSKIESGTLDITAAQWMKLCSEFNVDPNSLFIGRLNLASSRLSPELLSAKRVNGFLIPDDFSREMGSSVRIAYPFIRMLENKYGFEYSRNFLESLGFDPDYFVVLSNPISIHVVEKLVLHLVNKKVLTQSSIPSLFQDLPAGCLHNPLINNGIVGLADKQKINMFIESIPKYYETDLEYKFSKKGGDVLVHDAPYLADLNFSKDFNLFRMFYNFECFKYFQNEFLDKPILTSVKRNKEGWTLLAS